MSSFVFSYVNCYELFQVFRIISDGEVCNVGVPWK